MAKKTDVWMIGRRILIVFSLLSAIGWFGTTAIKEFAKFAKQEDMQKTTAVIDKLNDVIGLNASRHIVESKKGDVRWMQQQTMYEPRVQRLTEAENVMIKEEQSELAEIQSGYNDDVKRFKDKYNEKI